MSFMINIQNNQVGGKHEIAIQNIHQGFVEPVYL